MHNYYIFNGIVEFHPANSTLRHLENQQNIVVLNSPAGRCLLLLIKNKGKVVSQEEFMEEVWLKHGILVSPNTYYQNISILRKGLKKIGFDEEIVVTISRMGLTLSSDIVIEKKETEQPLEVDIIDDRIDQQSCNENKLIKSRPRGFGIFLNVATIFIIFSVAIDYYNQGKDYYEDFTIFKNNGNCKIFHYKGISDKKTLLNLLQYAKMFSNDCDAMPYIYIDSYPLLPRVSVIRCPEPITYGKECISDFFTGN